MKRKVILLLLMSLVFVPLSFAQTKVATFGNQDSTKEYHAEAKTDGIVYFRNSGGIVLPYELATTSDTISVQEAGKTFIINSTTPATFTLPTAQAGLTYRFVSATDVVYNVDPGASDTIVYDKGSLAAGAQISSPGTTGDTIMLFSPSTGSWYADANSAFASGNTNINFTGTLTVDGGITVGATTQPSVILDTTTSGDTDWWLANVADQGGDDNDVIQFGKGTVVGTNPLVYITPAGLVGIGESAPGEELHITSSGPELRLEDSDNLGSTLDLDYADAGSGAAQGTFNIFTAATTDNVSFRFFRSTDTTGSVKVELKQGNNSNTTTVSLGANTDEDSYFNTGGGVAIGTTGTAHMFGIEGGSGYGDMKLDGANGGCIMFRDRDDAGWTEVSFENGAIQSTTDADGVCDGS